MSFIPFYYGSKTWQQNKAGRRRTPAYHKRAIADKFFGFMMAGHDTTTTTVAWGVRFLTDNKASQDRLRAELHAAIPQAVQDKRAPTYQELIKAHVPYLDAVVDEVLRLANTIAFVARVAVQDTTVLGHHIPKGTDVFLMVNGAGYLEPNMLMDDAVRNPGARSHGGTGKPSQGCGMMPISLPSSLKDGWSSTQILARRCMFP